LRSVIPRGSPVAARSPTVCASITTVAFDVAVDLRFGTAARLGPCLRPATHSRLHEQTNLCLSAPAGPPHLQPSAIATGGARDVEPQHDTAVSMRRRITRG